MKNTFAKNFVVCALAGVLGFALTACDDSSSAGGDGGETSALSSAEGLGTESSGSKDQIEPNTDFADTNNKENDAVGKSIQELKRMFDDEYASHLHRLDFTANEADGTISYFAPLIQKMCVTPSEENNFKNAVLEKDVVINDVSMLKARYEVFNDSLILFPKMHMFAEYANIGDLYVGDHNDGIYGTWYSTGCTGGSHYTKYNCNDDEKNSYTYLKLDIGKDYIEVDGRHVVGRLHEPCGNCDTHTAYTSFFQNFVNFMEDTLSYSHSRWNSALEPTLGRSGNPSLPSWATFIDQDTLALINYAERTVSVKQIVEVKTNIKISLTVSSGNVVCGVTTYIYDSERIPDELCEDSRPWEVSGINKRVYTTPKYLFSSNGISYHYVASLIYTPVDEKMEFGSCLENLRKDYQKEPKFIQ